MHSIVKVNAADLLSTEAGNMLVVKIKSIRFPAFRNCVSVVTKKPFQVGETTSLLIHLKNKRISQPNIFLPEGSASRLI